jgi:hypothetical protein
MTTLFLGDLPKTTTMAQISASLKDRAPFSNLVILDHKRKQKKMALFKVEIADLELFLQVPILIDGFEYYVQLSQHQEELDLRIFEVLNRRIYIDKIPKTEQDSNVLNFLRSIFGFDSIKTFFSVKNRLKKSKGYGFFHVSHQQIAAKILNCGELKFGKKKMRLKNFKQKFDKKVEEKIQILKERKQLELQNFEKLKSRDEKDYLIKKAQQKSKHSKSSEPGAEDSSQLHNGHKLNRLSGASRQNVNSASQPLRSGFIQRNNIQPKIVPLASQHFRNYRLNQTKRIHENENHASNINRDILLASELLNHSWGNLRFRTVRKGLWNQNFVYPNFGY